MTDAPVQELNPEQDRREPEEVDPELLGLPDPPKRDRTMTVGLLVFTALASLVMILALRRDAAYAFASAESRNVGDLANTSGFVENEYVRATGMLGAAHAIRYERPLVSDSFRLMPVAGQPNVWVEVRIPPRAENIRWVPPTQFSGRLVRFETAGPRHRGLASAVKDATGEDISPNAWLLVDGAAPPDARWAVLLVGLFVVFAAWNAFATARLLRSVKE